MERSRAKKLLVLILGRSGAGITSSVKAMQDNGFFVIDNLPLKMIRPTVDLLEANLELAPESGYAIGVHTYSVPDVDKLNNLKASLRNEFELDVVFLKAKPEVLAKRFTTTRRPHPYKGSSEELLTCIREEKIALEELEIEADLVINTSELSPHVLARFLEARYETHIPQRKLLVSVTSFGFKHHESQAFDLIFDVRFLKNPYFNDNLRNKSGLEKEVVDFVKTDGNYEVFLSKLLPMLDFLLPQYYAEGKTYLRLGIGCTGGKHRSVTVAGDLFEHIGRGKYPFIFANLEHRDVLKN